MIRGLHLKPAVLLIAFAFNLLTSGCSRIVMGIYGIKSQPVPMSEKQLIAQASKWNIPDTLIYELDAIKQHKFFFPTDSLVAAYNSGNSNPNINDYLQPMQACYYDSTGKLISWFINCYAGGFPNLKWNKTRAFDQSFPPMPTMAPPDTLQNLNQQLSLFIPVGKSIIDSSTHATYTVVVYWSKTFGRQSKRLVKLVNKNLKLGHGKNIHLYYVNGDNGMCRFE